MQYLPEWAQSIILEVQINRFNTLELVGYGRSELLTEIPVAIFEMQWLQELDLSGNQITKVPRSIAKLTNLEKLDLSSNRLEELPDAFSQMKKLRVLNLYENSLSTLPRWVIDLPKLSKLQLSSNPITFPPREIIESGFSFSPVDLKKLRAYFQQIEEIGQGIIYEAKLIILGQPESGKTTLVKKLINPDLPLDPISPSTEGINVTKWGFVLNQPNFNRTETSKFKYKVNIWDFGGQEIYYSTHQFFLSRRSLYILVVDARKQKTDFNYWLNLITSRGQDSPVLIVSNEKDGRSWTLNEKKLREQFSNLKEILAVNFADTDNSKLYRLISAIKYHIASLPHISQTLPQPWIQVREALEMDSRPIISLNEYLELCRLNGLKRYDDKLSLSEYLHDLGICIHFQDEPLLKNLMILKPEWATKAIYSVLDNTKVIANKGRFSRSDLKLIWHDENYAPWREELLQIMIQFQICYSLDAEGNHIAPQLLSENEPDYYWDLNNNLILHYHFPTFMPQGLLTRFIVEMHQLIPNQDLVWKTGAVMAQNDTQAVIIEDYFLREIRIRVSGQQKRDLLTMITWEFDKIFNLFPGLEINRRIPCNCSRCYQHANPTLFNFDQLKKRLVSGKNTVWCVESNEDVIVKTLIDDSGIQEQRGVDYPSSKHIDLSLLRTKLVANFNKEELKTLCFDLDIDYDSLSAEGHEHKVRELVSQVDRTGILQKLIDRARHMRPHVTWP